MTMEWAGGTGPGLKEVLGTSNQINVSNGTTLPVLSLPNVSAGGVFTNADVTLDAKGRVLAASSGVGGGAPNVFVKIASGSLSNAANLIISNLSTDYISYTLVFSNLSSNTPSNLYAQTSTDNGTSFTAVASSYRRLSAGAGGGQTLFATALTTEDRIYLSTALSLNAGQEACGRITIVNAMNPAAYTRVAIESCEYNYITSSNIVRYTHLARGYRTNNEANNAIRFMLGSGTIKTMDYALYGLKNS